MIRNHPLTDFLAQQTRARVALILGAALAVAAALVGLTLAFLGPFYTAGLLVALGGGIWLVAGLQNALLSTLIIISLVPYGTLPFDIGVTPTFLDITMLVFFALYLGEWMTGQRRRLTVTPIHALVLLFMLLSLFSFVAGLRNAPLTSTLIRRFAELLLSMSLSLVLVDVIRTEKHLQPVVKVLMIAGAITGLLAVIYWVLPEPVLESFLSRLSIIGYPQAGIIQYVEQNPDLPERAIGMHANPNTLGGFLVMVAALMAPQVLTQQPITGRRWHALAMLGVMVLALVLTFSRGSMLAFAVAMLFVAAVRYRKLLVILAIIAMLIFVLPWTQFYVLRLIEGFRGVDPATQMRFNEYRNAFTLISRYPFFGVGFGGTPDVDLFLGVSSVYLLIASNMGMVGLFGFLVLMAGVFLYAFAAMRALAHAPEVRAVLLGLVAGLIAALFNGIFDHYFFNLAFHPAVTLVWVFVGLTLAASRIVLQRAADARHDARRRPSDRPALLG